MVKYNTETFINKANEKHNNKYDYCLTNYINSLTPVKIICPTHGMFEQTPVGHLRGRGCSSCAGKNKTTKQFINEANIIHNNKYEYSKVNYINATTPVIIICPIHGDFKQTPSSHLTGYSCRICGGNIRLTTKNFIDKANIIHNNRYDYSKVKYINSHKKITITCLIHGDFQQKPYNHFNGNNCPKCGAISTIKNNTLSNVEFINKCNKAHNYKYDYSKSKYIDSRHDVDITCSKHGIFTQIASSHLRGHGCPNCNESKGELKIKQILDEKNVNYVFQKTFNGCKNNNNRKLKYDFYLLKQNILIEYDGKQHYKPIKYFGGLDSYNKLKEYDNIKNTYATNNNITLIRISYKDYDNINNILSSFLE